MANSSKGEIYTGYVVIALLCIGLIYTFGMMLWALSHVLPVWSIVAGLLLLCIYNFDNLPLQHYWNPIVRELYPHRQWKFEQTLMRTLHQMNVVPLPRTTRNYANRLPSEIWSIILAHVVDIPFFFDTACEAKNFNLFITKQAYNTTHLEYLKSEKYRVELRLVCRQWGHFLEQHTLRLARSQRDWGEAGDILTRVDFNITTLASETRSPTPQALAASIGAPPKQASGLKIVVIRREPGPSAHTVHEFFRGLFVRHATEFTAIQSLVFGQESDIPAYHLLDIQQSFSNLTFLQLEGDTAYGILTLQRLDILRLNVMPVSIQQWWFPALRHLALGENYLRNQELDLGLIPAPTEQLLSLLLPVSHASINADQVFWSKLASVQFIGVALHSFTIVDDPPISHPLAHLCIAEAHSDKTLGKSKTDISAISISHFIDVTNRIPLLKLVTMPTVLDVRRDRYPTEWRSLFRLHKKSSVRWLDEFGETIDALRLAADRRPRWWEEYVYYGAAGYICFVHWILPRIFTLSYNLPLLLTAPGLIALAGHWLWGMYDSYLA